MGILLDKKESDWDTGWEFFCIKKEWLRHWMRIPQQIRKLWERGAGNTGKYKEWGRQENNVKLVICMLVEWAGAGGGAPILTPCSGDWRHPPPSAQVPELRWLNWPPNSWGWANDCRPGSTGCWNSFLGLNWVFRRVRWVVRGWRGGGNL